MKSLIVVIVLLFCIFCPAACAESLAVLTGRTDWNCVNVQPIGPCTRATPPYVGQKIRYWQPVLLVETVKRPGDTAINEFRPLVGEPARAAAAAAMGVGAQQRMDSCSWSSSDTTSVQMNDVHVFGFPLSSVFSGMIEPVCEGPPDLAGVVSYLSEMDAVEWRTLKTEASNPMSLLTVRMAPMCDVSGAVLPGMCMGVWGPLYPRGGFITGASGPVGSAAAAYRGVNIASLNMVSFHQRQFPVLFFPDMVWDRMQMVYPEKSRCLRIGEDPRYWEQDKVSTDGKYVWIYWRKKECCFL